MFKSRKISRLVAGAAGLAAALSSCGIQNQAGDSSSAPAGKIKNVALTSEWCYTTGATVDIGSSSRFGTIAFYAERSKRPASRNRYQWVSANEISDVYGPSIVRCVSLTPKVVAPAGATSAEELPPAFVENSTANQCISVEDRKKTIRAYDEQIMAHSLDQDKTIYEQMKTSRWVTTVQRPCTETSAPSELSALACVSVSHKAFEIAFYNEQYELYKDEAGTPYLDLIIIGKDKANSLVTC